MCLLEEEDLQTSFRGTESKWKRGIQFVLLDLQLRVNEVSHQGLVKKLNQGEIKQKGLQRYQNWVKEEYLVYLGKTMRVTLHATPASHLI